MRYALYARYSSDRQNERSVDDQLELLRERVAAEGGQVVAEYSDRAISGADMRNRPGLQALLAAAGAGAFEVVLAEALDRLSRDQADTATLHKRLSYAGIRIETLAEGEVTELHVGLKGTMNALYLKDLADKTRRGQRGRVEAGRIPGGLCYGYRKVVKLGADGEAERGLREIDPDQANVVRRIFAEYLAGRSAREIAQGLNRDGIPGPRGGTWAASAINGNRRRRNGILNNELYAGMIVYNRQSFRKDPETGRRTARPNPESQWRRHEVPELRIIDAATWAAVVDRQHALADVPPPRQRRPKRLLSGLLSCGSCGGPLIMADARYYACANKRERGTCDNGAFVRAERVEAAVIEGLGDVLASPELVEQYVTAYNAALREQRRAEAQRARTAGRELAQLEREIGRLVDAIAGGADVAAVREKLQALEARRVRLAAGAPVAAEIIDLHPNLADGYRRKLAELQAALEEGKDAAAQAEARATLRELVEGIRVITGERRGEAELEVHGRLAAIMRLAQGQILNEPRRVGLKVVAGAGFEPATFRL